VLARHLEQGETPLYASFDVRIHEGKAAAIDANAFPGGFNNLGPAARRSATAAFRHFVHDRGWRSARLLAEGHTRNAAYQQNVDVLTHLLRDAGLRVTASAEAECAPLVILNRDLADGPPHAVLECPEVLPPLGMGWHVRRKAGHSRELDAVVEDLAGEVGFDPWLLRAEWEAVDGVSFSARDGIDRVADAVDAVASRAATAARAHAAEAPEKVFVKADPGTYGMAVMPFADGAEVRSINSRGRSKMERGKGGLVTQSVLVQEGVGSALAAPGEGAAEPCVYVVAGKQVGGFLRRHAERGAFENLNTPGATFVPFGPRGPSALPPHLRNVLAVAVDVAHAAVARETAKARRLPATA